MSEEDVIKHNELLQLERAERASREERTWVPLREVKTILRPSFTSSGGLTYKASDYGHAAFPMDVKGKHRGGGSATSAYALDRNPLHPVKSNRRLSGGFAAGDRIYHPVFGPGIILSIARAETILQFNTGLRSFPTVSAHLLLERRRN
ncbi:MAG: hypothetical protein JST11_12265 [Acidobacteria bacterium]|nr:hypothetical protein [Acidobacteriota bacterium]